jgi:hypothetical protein
VENRLAAAEDMTDEELEALHADCKKRADEALESLNVRRAQLNTIAEKGEGRERPKKNGRGAKRA